jgi:hypothetical protein
VVTRSEAVAEHADLGHDPQRVRGLDEPTPSIEPAGSVVDVWADAVEGLAGPDDQRDYRFCALMDIPPRDQPGFDATARTPEDAGRVEVTVARFPRSCVAGIATV